MLTFQFINIVIVVIIFFSLNKLFEIIIKRRIVMSNANKLW
jgi:hypothetical protein